MHKPRFSEFSSKLLTLFCVFGGAAFAGTVSPDINTFSPNLQVQVIVQYSAQSTANGAVLSTVNGALASAPTCGGTLITANVELCQMTPAAALLFAQTPGVAHISMNHSIQGTGESVERADGVSTGKPSPLSGLVPVYDYLPETLHPNSVLAAALPDFKAGRKIGVAVIDS